MEVSLVVVAITSKTSVVVGNLSPKMSASKLLLQLFFVRLILFLSIFLCIYFLKILLCHSVSVITMNRGIAVYFLFTENFSFFEFSLISTFPPTTSLFNRLFLYFPLFELINFLFCCGAYRFLFCFLFSSSSFVYVEIPFVNALHCMYPFFSFCFLFFLFPPSCADGMNNRENHTICNIFCTIILCLCESAKCQSQCWFCGSSFLAAAAVVMDFVVYGIFKRRKIDTRTTTVSLSLSHYLYLCISFPVYRTLELLLLFRTQNETNVKTKRLYLWCVRICFRSWLAKATVKS